MKRREFIKTGLIAGGAAFLPAFVKASGLFTGDIQGEKRLVVIQLAGGNDGLNTIVPFRDDLYYIKRPEIAIKKADVIKITDELGFNKSLAPLKTIYDDGNLLIFNNVGYPDPNRSHFRSTDIWQTAADSNRYFDSGWMGRFIEVNGGKPWTGIELDDSLSLIMKGKTVNGIAARNPGILFRNSQTPYFKKILEFNDGMSHSNQNLDYLYKTMIEAESSAKYIFKTSGIYKSKLEYPSNPFGRQLKTTAGFINSGLETKVYFISMGGFDTHANQNARQNRLLEIYSGAMEVFINDLKQNNTFNDTLILTFSEFGRRVKQNAANGTDHGTANNLFLMGGALKKNGFYNEPPDLNHLDKNGDLIFTVDFRSIYATVLNKWLQTDDKAVLKKSFKKLNFI